MRTEPRTERGRPSIARSSAQFRIHIHCDAMKKSPEIEAVVRRYWDAILAGDADAIRNLTSYDPNARYIATADDEWWLGSDNFVRLAVQRATEVGFVRLEYDRLEAFEHGDVGWAAASVTALRRSGDTLSFRFTTTFILEAGIWRVVQWHGSVGVPNPEVFGYDITTSLNGLVSSLDEASAELVAAAAPSGTVTLMFTDIEGSTRMSEQQGDDRWSEIIDRHFASVRQIVERAGGTLIKTLGDGTMIAFPAVRDALSSAVELQRSATGLNLRIRIGVHTGDALHSAGDYVGITVNKAARIASAAAGGEILISSVTAELATGQDVDLGPGRVVELKGLDGTHRIVPVIWSDST